MTHKKRELLPISKGLVDESAYDMEVPEPFKYPKQPKKHTPKPKPKPYNRPPTKKNIQIPVKAEHYEQWKHWDNPDKVRIVKSVILERLGLI